MYHCHLGHDCICDCESIFLIHMGMFYAKGRSVDRAAITFTNNNSNNNVGVNGVAGVDFGVGSSDGGSSGSLEFDGGDILFVEGGGSLRGRRSLFE